MATRQEVCASAAKKLAAADLSAVRVLVGLDGFVDEIIDVVDKRTSHENYDRIHTIAQWGQKISAAAGQSCNFELVVKQQKLGGNGPIMGNALASMGWRTTYIGNLGVPTVHPVFQEFAKRAEVISFAEPAHTNALEFTDGKVMLGNMGPLNDVTFERMVAAVGMERLVELMERSSLIGLVNWTMLPHMTGVWERVLMDIVPKLSGKPRKIFVDLADPERRLVEDLRGALGMLTKLNEKVHVILGLNLSEAQQVAGALGLPKLAEPESAVAVYATKIREKLNLGTVVVHPRKGAAAANAAGSAEMAGPFIAQPKISTGAGDHFNAGFCAGQLLGMTLEESLAIGVGTSGYYVRNAESPTAAKLAAFVAEMPGPQG
ncbi:MAG: PfkB family carbohydrate kinase [Phycisphaerae bacterium]